MANNKITLMLLKPVPHLGKAGDIVEVGSAQARNMLIPKWLAKEYTATPSNNTINESLIANKQHIQDTLNGITLEFDFGSHHHSSVHIEDIVEKIKKDFRIKLTKKHIKLLDGKTMKKSGTYDIGITLDADTYIKLHVKIA